MAAKEAKAAMQLKGLHHLTAVTGEPSVNVAFYTQVLGLRLVKKTVNQDDTSAYHLFYGDALGSPGTEVTFFDWPHAGATYRGAGCITATALRVPGLAALEAWARRLSDFGVRHDGIRELGGRAVLAFADPEGQRLELMDGGSAPGGRPWPASPVAEDMAIRGLHAVRLAVRRAAPTARLLTELLGFREAEGYEDAGGSAVRRFEAGPGGPGTEVLLEKRPELGSGRVGIGGVHHVAFRTPDEAQQEAWRRRLADAGVGVTPVIDRFYFRSIYFREPGGVLFEIATDGPGFATDEDEEHLGERLALPPFLEPHRAGIEAGLQPIQPVRMQLLRHER
jgi:glyoxalase family protein